MTVKVSPFFSALLPLLTLASLIVPGIYVHSVSAQPKPLVIIIVDSSVYGAIKPSLDQYCLDLEGSGFSVNVTETDLFSDRTPTGIRVCLQEARSKGLEGALLVGDIPEAWFEVGDRRFPTDMYYMDLDGVWFDLDNDGLYDARGGNMLPEVWIGRLKVSTVNKDQSSVLRTYFSKNHAFRIGALFVPWWRSLIYIDDMGTSNRQDAEASLGYVTTDKTVVTDPAITNTTDFKNRLGDERGYQWLYLMSHGHTGGHDFYGPNKESGVSELEGTVYSTDYKAINPRIFFYQFFTCEALRYVDEDYLGGAAVFETTWGLAAVGSTDNMYTVSSEDFYRPLSEKKSLGQAFKQWLCTTFREHEKEYLTVLDYQIMCNAMTFIGDPTLVPIVETHDVAVTSLEVTVENGTGVETLIFAVNIENKGEFDEEIKVEIFYDAMKVFAVDLFLKKGGNSNLLFSPLDSYQFIWGTHSMHMVEAKVSITSGEFQQSDNTQVLLYEGKVIKNPSPFQLPFIFFALAANVALGLAGWAVLKQLMSERPSFLVYLAKMSEFLKRKLAR